MMAAIASASASVILINIVILLVTQPEAAPAHEIAQLGLYSRGGIRMGVGKKSDAFVICLTDVFYKPS
jgi:hypothetical protein